MRNFKFGDHIIGDDAPVFLIAEIGINHEGNAALCARMIEAAASSGADAVKLQTVDPDSNYCFGSDSHKLFSASSLTMSELDGLFRYARGKGLAPFTTVGDLETLAELQFLDLPGYKVSSGLLTATPLISKIATSVLCGFGSEGYIMALQAMKAYLKK